MLLRRQLGEMGEGVGHRLHMEMGCYHFTNLKNIQYLPFLCAFPNAPALLAVAFSGSTENLDLKRETWDAMQCLCVPFSDNTKAKKQGEIFLKNFMIPNRWATWTLHGLGGQKPQIQSRLNTCTGEPQPMRWNEITDGDTERKDAVPRRHVTLTGSRGRLSGPVSPDCTDLFLFPRPHEYLSSSVVKTNLMRYRRSRRPSFFEEFTASSHCLLVM